jgi:hypothetical protein
MEILVVVVLSVAAFMVLTGLFQLLWNTTMPGLFGLKPITARQAFGLPLILLIVGLLLGTAIWIPFYLLSH